MVFLSVWDSFKNYTNFWLCALTVLKLCNQVFITFIIVTFTDKSGTLATTPTREDAFVVQRGRTVPTLSSVARTGSPAPNLELDKHLKEKQNQVWEPLAWRHFWMALTICDPIPWHSLITFINYVQQTKGRGVHTFVTLHWKSQYVCYIIYANLGFLGC